MIELHIKLYLNFNDILPIKQSGFRQGQKSAIALDVMNDVLTAYYNKIFILILLENSREFDLKL